MGMGHCRESAISIASIGRGLYLSARQRRIVEAVFRFPLTALMACVDGARLSPRARAQSICETYRHRCVLMSPILVTRAFSVSDVAFDHATVSVRLSSPMRKPSTIRPDKGLRAPIPCCSGLRRGGGLWKAGQKKWL